MRDERCGRVSVDGVNRKIQGFVKLHIPGYQTSPSPKRKGNAIEQRHSVTSRCDARREPYIIVLYRYPCFRTAFVRHFHKVPM
jgi:hypothetical protein